MARWKEGNPQTTIRPPHTAHPRIEGTKVTPTVRGGKRFKEFSIIKGDLSLLIEPAATDFTSPSSEVLKSLVDNAVLLRDATEKEEEARKIALDARKEREGVRGTIVPVINENPNLRGFRSESRDVRLTATPTDTTVVFDIDLLRKSAGTEGRFRKLTSRRMVIEITPRKDMDPDVLKAIVEEGLDSLGARVARRANVTITWVVDDEVVAETVSSGEMTLLPGARRVEEGLSVKAEHLHVRQKSDAHVEALLDELVVSADRESVRMGELRERIMREIDGIDPEDSVDLSNPPVGILNQDDLAVSTHRQFRDRYERKRRASGQSQDRPGLITDEEIERARIEHGDQAPKHR